MARRGGVDAVFGPVAARAEDGSEIGPFGPYFARGVTAEDGADITALSAYLGTNNSLFTASVCAGPGGPFEERLNHIGGEDSLFLKRLVRDRRRFAWAAGPRSPNGSRAGASTGTMSAAAAFSAVRSAPSSTP